MPSSDDPEGSSNLGEYVDPTLTLLAPFLRVHLISYNIIITLHYHFLAHLWQSVHLLQSMTEADDHYLDSVCP